MIESVHPTGPGEKLPPDATLPASPSRSLLWLLAVTAGATVANIYYCQPLLGAIAATFRVGSETATHVAAATQFGVATGFLLLVPLGDSFERKRLIVGTTALSALTLCVVALAPTIGTLIAASYVMGLICVTPHFVVPYAAAAVSSERRGRTVGTVMSGLLIGILLSRTLSGSIGAHTGWRAVFLLAAAAMLILTTVLLLALPPQAPARRIPYGELFGSIWTLLFTEPVLRRHALVGAAGMGAFSAFWTTLTFHLANQPAHYGSETAGLFGLVGAAGAVAAAAAGRVADRVGPRALNGAALLLIVLSFWLMGVSGHSLVVLAIGVILMDAGVQASHISNQTRIYALSAEMRNRLNGVYMVIYFLGGATGSALGSRAWESFGWTGVCTIGATLGLAGLVALFALGNAKAHQPVTTP